MSIVSTRPSAGVHVTLKLDPSLPNLRTKAVVRVVEQCLRKATKPAVFRLVHYSVQAHHIHTIVEAHGAKELSAGVKGLSVRIAKRLNRALGRRGRVFVDRYFTRILKTPAQTKVAIAYVLLNARRHDAQRGRVRDRFWIDPCSSGRFFDGWSDIEIQLPLDEVPSVSSPHTWLLATGWRLRGLLSVNAVPGATRAKRSRAKGRR